jgi:hypothetical protein
MQTSRLAGFPLGKTLSWLHFEGAQRRQVEPEYWSPIRSLPIKHFLSNFSLIEVRNENSMAWNGVKLPRRPRFALFVEGSYEFCHGLVILGKQYLVARLNLLEQFGELSGFDFLRHDHAMTIHFSRRSASTVYLFRDPYE